MGFTQVQVTGSGAARIAAGLYAKSAAYITREQLLDCFESDDKPAAQDLLDHLIARRLFISDALQEFTAEETPLDIFYWHFGDDVRSRIASYRITVVGLNAIGILCAEIPRSSGFDSLTLADDPMLRDVAGEKLLLSKTAVEDASLPDILEETQIMTPDKSNLRDAECVVSLYLRGAELSQKLESRECCSRSCVYSCDVARLCCSGRSNHCSWRKCTS